MSKSEFHLQNGGKPSIRSWHRWLGWQEQVQGGSRMTRIFEFLASVILFYKEGAAQSKILLQGRRESPGGAVEGTGVRLKLEVTWGSWSGSRAPNQLPHWASTGGGLKP